MPNGYTSKRSGHGLTHHFINFWTFGHSGAQSWAPECPNVQNIKNGGLDQYGAERSDKLIFHNFCHNQNNARMKGLTRGSNRTAPLTPTTRANALGDVDAIYGSLTETENGCILVILSRINSKI